MSLNEEIMYSLSSFLLMNWLDNVLDDAQGKNKKYREGMTIVDFSRQKPFSDSNAF
jgi:ethanolamine transporter EutH